MNQFKCVEKDISIPFSLDFNKINNVLSSRFPKEHVLRFISSEFTSDSFKANILTATKTLHTPNIFKFEKRNLENENNFNVCFLIPTGIGCEIGGHAGDATPALRLISTQCDTVIIHPNVVNASDINEMPRNTLYVEGYHLTNFLMGNIGLMKPRKNRIFVLIHSTEESKKLTSLTVNSVNAARATLGIDAEILLIESDIKMNAFFNKEKKAIGEVFISESLIEFLKQREGSFDAIAISSPIKIPKKVHETYSKSNGEMVNPWGGVESMLTHFISSQFNKPTAHAPMLESENILTEDFGVVDSRIASEIVSSTFFHSVLKGLHQAPKIVDNSEGISAKDISAIIVPDGTLGLPILAALQHGIKVIAVENKNTMKNDLSKLPWSEGQFFKCKNYLEVCGTLSCLREGINVKSIERPLEKSDIIDKSKKTQIFKERLTVSEANQPLSFL